MKNKILLFKRGYTYSIRKSKRAKYLRIQISREGEIELIIPKNVSIKKGIDFIEGNKNWIENRINKIGQKRKNLRYLGNKIIVSIKTGLFIENLTYDFNGNELIVSTPSNELSEAELFDIWLFRKAKEYIPERTAEIAAENSFEYNRVSVKKLKSRWGSCSSKRNLSFNYKLMYFNSKIIDYVITHELCHLVELNHSVRFWNLVESIIPDYKKLKRDLLVD